MGRKRRQSKGGGGSPAPKNNRNKQQKRHNSESPSARRPKFWIQEQQQAANEEEYDVTLLLSSVHLEDEHRITTPEQRAAVLEEKQRLQDESQAKGIRAFVASSAEPKDVSMAAASAPKKTKESEAQNGTAASEEKSKPSVMISVHQQLLNMIDWLQNWAKPAAAAPEVASKLEEEAPPKVARIRQLLHSSMTAPSPKKKQFQLFTPELPNGDCGDGIVNPFDESVVPHGYWAQRRRLFTKYDAGIQMDPEGWYSVTPQVIANHVCDRMVAPVKSDGMIVLDAFCGVGGNAIAFARHEHVALVVCVDTNRQRLQMAAHNCRIYDIPKHKVVFVHANACRVLQSYRNGKLTTKATMTTIKKKHHNNDSEDDYYAVGGLELLPATVDGIFLSPPWGGVEYANLGPSHYDLSCIAVRNEKDEVVSGTDLLALAQAALDPTAPAALAFFLPRNTNGTAVAQQAWQAGLQEQTLELEANYLCGKLKTITLYARDCVAPQEESE